MRVGSTFSGVGGFDLGFERAGMSVVWQAEIDEWSRRVLRWHWPAAAIFDDVRSVNREAGGVDLLCGGFPCQDLSVAGKRAGFKGERSSLFFEFARIADDLKPRWIVLENVAGLLSSSEGRDFGILLSTLAELGYGCAWRLVDARFFGVPQRRRRVFIVGCLGDNGERAVRALGSGGEGDLKAGKCSWQGNTESVKGGAGGAIGVITEPIAKCLTTSNQRLDSGTESFVVQPASVTSFAQNQRGELRESDIAAQLTTGGGTPGQGYPAVRIERPIVAPTLTAANNPSRSPQSAEVTKQIEAVHRATVSFLLGNTKANGSNVNTDGVAYTLDRAVGQGVLLDTLGTEVSKPLLSSGGRTTDLDSGAYVASCVQASGPPGTRRDDEASLVASQSSVRRLTPTECERLMSWPDGWTAVDGEETPDGRRYAACGNGVVANVSEWIGRRIMTIEEEKNV